MKTKILLLAFPGTLACQIAFAQVDIVTKWVDTPHELGVKPPAYLCRDVQTTLQLTNWARRYYADRYMMASMSQEQATILRLHGNGVGLPDANNFGCIEVPDGAPVAYDTRTRGVYYTTPDGRPYFGAMIDWYLK